MDYRKLNSPAWAFSGMSIVLGLLVVVWFADPQKHRWFKLPGLGSFQPSEFAKPVLILFLAYFLENKLKSMDDWRHTLLPAAIPVALFAGLIVLEPDLGTAIACVAVAATILYVAGMRLRYFGYAIAASLLPLYLLIFRVQWRYERILAFLNPYSDPQGRGFHVIQSLIAVGTGGFAGVGLMEGKQKLFFLPEPHTDFVFAVIGEELGFIGALFVLALFGVILWRGLRAAAVCPNELGRLLAIGLTVLVVGQALVNISVVLGLLPTKGIALPLVSYGGSSLLANLAAVGILLNISQHAS